MRNASDARNEKARESRLRGTARRQGYALVKSRTRREDAFEFGRFFIIDADRNSVVAGTYPVTFSMDLDDVEAWLSGRLSC